MFTDVSKEHAAYVHLEEKGGIVDRAIGRQRTGTQILTEPIMVRRTLRKISLEISRSYINNKLSNQSKT
jgi:hypothetical protein